MSWFSFFKKHKQNTHSYLDFDALELKGKKSYKIYKKSSPNNIAMLGEKDYFTNSTY